MSRRYLTIQEVESSLKRGKEVEVFIGGFESGFENCIRWISFNSSEDGVVAKIWESVDEGSDDYCDIYSFTPLSREWDEPVKSIFANNILEVMAKLSVTEFNFVNYGVAQDEYADFKLKNTENNSDTHS